MNDADLRAKWQAESGRIGSTMAGGPAMTAGLPPRSLPSPRRSGARFRAGVAGCELILADLELSESAVRAVAEGPAEFALVREAPLIVLLYRFGPAVPWGDVPFAWPLSAAAGPPPAELPAGASLPLRVRLVDRRGATRARREVPLDPPFGRALNDAIRAQARTPLHSADYVRAIAEVYLRHPTPTAQLALAEARTAVRA